MKKTIEVRLVVIFKLNRNKRRRKKHIKIQIKSMKNTYLTLRKYNRGLIRHHQLKILFFYFRIPYFFTIETKF